MTAVRAYMWDAAGREGIILCARQFMNSLDDSSLEEIKAAIRSEPWLEAAFEIGEKYVRTKSGRISYKFTGLDRNVDSVKSKARILLCWIDEAEPVTETAFEKLIPTLREEDSELWVTWNPESERAAVHKRFRLKSNPRHKVVEINWRDNPWFPAILDRKRLDDKEDRPDSYEHVWEGAFKTAQEGAYFTRQLSEAKREGRIGNVARDPLMEVRAYWDIGGTGAKADATAIWLVQFVGKEIRWLDHYEASGQPLEAHVNWIRSKPYPVRTCVLPHDGAQHDKVYAVTYEGALRQAGFSVLTVPNQGRGAAMQRVEALRRLFPSCWFHQPSTEDGLSALGWYHAKKNEAGHDMGPEHDWSSHTADAAGLVAVHHAQHGPSVTKIPKFEPIKVV
jgi:phage terminase large subunit